MPCRHSVGMEVGDSYVSETCAYLVFCQVPIVFPHDLSHKIENVSGLSTDGTC